MMINAICVACISIIRSSENCLNSDQRDSSIMSQN